MKKPVIAVFGANPAWQKTIFFDRLTPGEVNRAAKLTAFASGKGVNFCRASACAKLTDTHLFQFADGDNGRKHQISLDAEKIAHTSIPTGSETRVCATCIDLASGQTTELIEPSFPADRAACDEMVERWQSALPRFDGAAITGSLPDKTDPALYCRIAEAAVAQKLPLLIDAVSGILPTLEKLDRFILKINAGELKKLLQVHDLHQALHHAATRWQHAVFAITDGASEAYLAADGAFYRYRLPRIDVVNPIGSGDTCSAILMGRLLTGMEAPQAFACALAAASANCLDPTPGHFDEKCAGTLIPAMERI